MKNNKHKKRTNKKESSKKESSTIAATVISGVISALLVLVFTRIADPWLDSWFNKPKITFSTQNISNVRREASKDLNNEKPLVFDKYSGRLISKTTGRFVDKNVYGFIRGDADSPGCADIVLQLANHGNTLAVLEGVAIKVMEYHPIKDIDYVLFDSQEIENPDKYTLFYCCLDPIIGHSVAEPVEISTDGQIRILDSIKASLRLSPDEYGTYYAKIKFSQYGLYKLKLTVYYKYAGKEKSYDINKPVYILYDGLSDSLIVEKQKEYKKLINKNSK